MVSSVLLGFALGEAWDSYRASDRGSDMVTADTAPINVQALTEGAPREQTPALEDGLITDEEYRLSVEATARCMQAAGIELFIGTPTAEGVMTFYYGGNTGVNRFARDREADMTFDSCYDRHQSIIELLWFQQIQTRDSGVGGLESGGTS